MEGGNVMERNLVMAAEANWQEINTTDCEESSLYNMCSWAEAN